MSHLFMFCNYFPDKHASVCSCMYMQTKKKSTHFLYNIDTRSASKPSLPCYIAMNVYSLFLTLKKLIATTKKAKIGKIVLVIIARKERLQNVWLPSKNSFIIISKNWTFPIKNDLTKQIKFLKIFLC
jgi:hypothetical protein